MIYKLFLRAPKWVIAIGIIATSTTLFVMWWLFQEPEVAPSVVASKAPKAHSEATESTPLPSEPVAASLFAENPILLGGRDLLEFREGDIHLLQKDWIDREPALGEIVIYLKEPNVLTIASANKPTEVFGLDGSSRGRLTLSNGDPFEGYVGEDFSQAIFVKNGDLWKGQTDWTNVKIVNETQLTSVGYFQSSQFQGRLLGATSNGLVYRDIRYGNVAVDLTTGEVTPIQLPANASSSPTGRFIVGDVPTRPAQFFVLDVDTAEATTHVIPWNIPQNGLAWLDETRAALILKDQVLLYEHETQSLSSLYQSSEQRTTLSLVAPPLLGQPYLMFQDSSKGAVIMNVETKEFQLVTGPPANAIQMLEGGAFIFSSDVPDTEQRGTWLGRFGTPDPARLFAQPVLTRYDSNRSGRVSGFAIPGSDYALLRAFDRWHALSMKTSTVSDISKDLDSKLHLIQVAGE